MAIVFGPTLVAKKNPTLEDMKDQSCINEFVELLITNCKYIYVI